MTRILAIDPGTKEIGVVLGRTKGLKDYEYIARTVRKIICQNGRTNKKDVDKVPDCPNQDRKWKEKCWQNTFHAIALGIVHLFRHRRA